MRRSYRGLGVWRACTGGYAYLGAPVRSEQGSSRQAIKPQAVANTGRESGDLIAAMKRVTIVEPRGARRVVYQKWRHLKHKEVQTNANPY